MGRLGVEVQNTLMIYFIPNGRIIWISVNFVVFQIGRLPWVTGGGRRSNVPTRKNNFRKAVCKTCFSV